MQQPFSTTSDMHSCLAVVLYVMNAAVPTLISFAFKSGKDANLNTSVYPDFVVSLLLLRLECNCENEKMRLCQFSMSMASM